MKQLYQLLKTGYKERKVLLMTSILIAAIRLGLLLLPFQRLLKLLDQFSQQNNTVRLSVRKILWSVNAVSSRIPGIKCKCLARALTTQVLMKRYGHTSKLQIGVAKTAQGNLEAHAWVEVGGVIAIGNIRNISRFIPLSSLEGVKQ
ncbi:lasso peptide biosynthesis B2 protein [Mastigocoleus testarum]|uniref:Microcin J25-processing protein McjB C-terminal domain-containing protein n=1 Tax=Mastigocoleus testarum BC008 TaxID=371196 RepID=A0A0V7ZT19_9CYAN|nr:lasso peptide biosynthesis B2 protein [Mastigocoleus testarum]KST67763.1 hypothetical protein BC008_44260 [Mastigocoleus testarum BC008]